MTYFLAECTSFVPITRNECPSNGLGNMKKCSFDMHYNELCNADRILPDGTADYDVNNCPGGFDVFKCANPSTYSKVFISL